MKYPLRYLPKQLSKKDKKIYAKEMNKSRKKYKKKQYYTRKKVKSFKRKTSQHILNARKIYDIENISASKELAKKTGCKISALKKIISKGQGAYYSSGSRPNQTAHSWGRARLASAITGGKSSQIDYHILEKYCSPDSKALKLANNSIYKNNIRKTQKIK